ncbi:MAG: hypothetical protein AAFQ94_10200 [Bacteroidota bacterium]
MKGTLIKLSLIGLLILLGNTFSEGQVTGSTNQENEMIPLEQFVGYFNVGVKPNKPFFKSRWYLRDGKLFCIYDSDRDREIVPYENGKLNPTIFLSEEDVQIKEKDSTYYLVLNFEENQLKSFRVIRPRSEWSTDLFGYRIKEWDLLAIDTEKSLTHDYETEHFSFQYSLLDSAQIPKLANHLESNYDRLLSDFGLKQLPKTRIKIYPDYYSYHNAVLTPNAPKWQRGRAWDNDEIRMLSPIVAEEETGEVVVMNNVVLHEFVHCIHLNLIKDGTRVPGWLWEGIAMYKGCCNWVGNPKSLDYVEKGKIPTLKQIEKDRTYELKYDLGYFILEFLDKKYGWKKVLQLIDNNGQIEDALEISTKDFQNEFSQYMRAEYLDQ